MPHPWSKVYLSVGIVGRNPEPIWRWSTWSRAVPLLQPLVDLTPEKPSIRTTQTDRKGGPKLGKPGWNDKGHRTWTHGSPDNAEASRDWVFYQGEIWAPSWNKCTKPDRAPDLYFSLRNPHAMSGGRTGEYNQLFHIALPADVAGAQAATVRAAAGAMGDLLEASHVVGRVGPWFQDGMTLQDEINNRLRSDGRHDDPVYALPAGRFGWTPLERLLF